MSLEFHPDKNPNCGPECTTKFAQIGLAYKKLSDPKKREQILKGMSDKDAKKEEDSPIPSETFSLTDSNFDWETQSKDTWLIQVMAVSGSFQTQLITQVYTDWSTAAWDVVSDWEKTYDEIGKYINMGRINFAKQPDLAKRFQIYVSTRTPKTILILCSSLPPLNAGSPDIFVLRQWETHRLSWSPQFWQLHNFHAQLSAGLCVAHH